ncbi:hypothetical protein ScPMuIL_016526 [Solemya velum]
MSEVFADIQHTQIHIFWRVSNESRQNLGNKLQLHLTLLDEKYRSRVLYQQVEAFEEKVYLCEKNFRVGILYKMYLDLARRSGIPRKIISVAKIRQAYLLEQRRVRRRNYSWSSDNRRQSEDDTLKYFAWFFDYLVYLRELRTDFTERIFNPLFKHFYESGSTLKEKESRSQMDSAISVSDLTVTSARSLGSNMSDLTLGTSTISGFSQMSGFSFSETVGDQNEGQDDIQTTRKRMMSRAALLVLSREFRDIRSLYDSSEIEKIAQRLSQLKERLDFLIDTESPIENDLMSQDSTKYVYSLKIRDQNVENLIRFLPDIIVKFQKLAWLSRKWLEVDETKTKDINKRLNKLATLEKQLNHKVSILSHDIQRHEETLETEANSLMELLRREDRADDLSVNLFNIQGKLGKIRENLESLKNANHSLTTNLLDAVKAKDEGNIRRLKTLQEQNKLQRYALERHAATLEYHKTLLETDMQLELEVKPNLILLTNDVQDKCEELEKVLEKKRKEKRTIQAALLPIKEDKAILTQRLHQVEQMRNAATPTDENSADTTPRSNFFITALPSSPANVTLPLMSKRESPDMASRNTKSTYPIQPDDIRSVSSVSPLKF